MKMSIIIHHFFTVGVQVNGINSGVLFAGNIFYNHTYGFQVAAPTGAIAPQLSLFNSNIPLKNQWVGSYTNAAIHWNPTNAQTQKIYYPLGTSLGQSMRPNFVSPSDWLAEGN